MSLGGGSFLARPLSTLSFAGTTLFALGLTTTTLIRLGLGFLAKRRENHGHVASFGAGGGLDRGDLGQLLSKSTKQTHALLGAGLLASLETKIELDLVATVEEALGLSLLRLVVVAINLQADTNRLDDRVGLVPAGLASLLSRLVFELPVVHELRDGWVGVRRNLDKIQSGLLGKAEGILHADDAYLFTTRADKANLIDVDALIDSWFVVNGCSSKFLDMRRARSTP